MEASGGGVCALSQIPLSGLQKPVYNALRMPKDPLDKARRALSAYQKTREWYSAAAAQAEIRRLWNDWMSFKEAASVLTSILKEK